MDGARRAEGQEEGRSTARSTTASIRRCSCGCSPRTSRTTSSRAGTRSTTRSAESGRATRKELREARNDWAHNKSFSDDDAYRCLDTAERLLTAIGAPAVADEVKAIRLDLRRLTADKDDRKVLKSAAVTPESAGLRPWREVLAPHEDVATGNFQAAEFAADLYKVAATEDAGKDYADRSSSSRART